MDCGGSSFEGEVLTVSTQPDFEYRCQSSGLPVVDIGVG